MALNEAGPSAELRTSRLPAEDRTWHTAGFDYDFSPKMRINLSYALIDIDKATVDKTATPGSEDFLRGSFIGDFDYSVNILSAQFRWKFGGGS